MTFGPIERRLSESTAEDSALAERAGALLRALPEPAPLSSRADARLLASLRDGLSGAPHRRIGLRSAGFFAIFAFSVAASATRGWWQPAPPPPPAEVATPVIEPGRGAAPAAPKPMKPAAPAVVEEPPLAPAEVKESPRRKIAAAVPQAAEPAPVETPRPPQIKPRLLTDLAADPHRPRIPFEVARTGTKIAVLLEICVAASGSVYDARILASEHPRLDERILEHVRRFKYAPARSGGRPVPFCFPLRYRLNVDPNPSPAPRTP